MKIIKLLYRNYALSFFICILLSFTVFFIFSLISNLNEDLLFSKILILSLLNTIQIITYVPAFIFLISVILLMVFLRSKNEIIIIKSYLNIHKLMLFFFPIVLIFTFLEINKKDLSLFFEDHKISILNDTDISPIKILVDKKQNYKSYMVLKNIDLKNMENAEFRSYTVLDRKIEMANFSNNLFIIRNSLILDNFTQFKNDLIRNINSEKIINLDLNKLINKSNTISNISNKDYYEFDLKLLNLSLFFILFFNYIFLNFFNSKYVSLKQNLIIPIMVCFSILIYSFFVFNNSLSLYFQEFEIIASMVVGMFFLKVFLNE